MFTAVLVWSVSRVGHLGGRFVRVKVKVRFLDKIVRIRPFELHYLHGVRIGRPSAGG